MDIWQKDKEQENLIFIKSTLKKITEKYNFDSFSQTVSFGRFLNNLDGNYSFYQSLSQWEISPFTHVNFFGGGNCLDLALITQSELAKSGIKVELLSRSINLNKFTTKQLKYMKIGHVALLYKSNLDACCFLLEPSYRFYDPIPIKVGAEVANSERQFEIIEVDRENFIQVETNLINGQKSRPRKFSSQPININYEVFQKKTIRIKKNLEIVNKLKSGYPKLYVQFLPDKLKFFTNIFNLPAEFLPEELNCYHNQMLSKIFELEDLVGYLREFYNFYISIAQSFWVR